MPAPNSPHRRGGFTLVELLVVIAIIGILFSLTTPALSKAKAKSRAVRCAANMKNWAWATQLYLGDYNDRLPLFGEHSEYITRPFWHGKLAPYLGKKSAEGDTFYGRTEVFGDDIRRCPGGFKGRAPFANEKTPVVGWNSWIGANFGGLGEPLTAPFYYGDRTPPLNVNVIGNPSDAMLFMDSLTHVVYNPVGERYRFALDLDEDGKMDSMSAYPDTPFNYGRPTVHSRGANVTLLDGHVERVGFSKLWQVDKHKKVTHSYWYLND